MANKAIEIAETQSTVGNSLVEASLKHAEGVIRDLEEAAGRHVESMLSMQTYLSARNWVDAYAYADDGPDLDQLKDASVQIRNLVAMNSHMKRGYKLRTSYIWDGGIHHSGIPKATTDGRSKTQTPDVQARIDNPINKHYYFGQQAREERELALFADSQAFLVGDEADYTLGTIPIHEISGDYRNPDRNAEIWAYRHTWTRHTATATGSVASTESEWIWTNLFWAKRKASIVLPNGDRQKVSETKRLFGNPVNSGGSWAYGIPDGLSAMAWARIYREFLISGKTMSDALASIWASATVNSKAGASNAAMKLAEPSGAGQTAILGGANALTPLATAGKGYDFESGRPLLAVMATALEVSVVALASDPGAAGSSYGSAQTLDLPGKLAIRARRQFHVDQEKEILAWLGAPDAEVWFDSLDDKTDEYRQRQGILLAWGSGLYSAEEIKGMLEELRGRKPNPVPVGVLLPNNEASLARKDIDADSAGGNPATGGNLTPTQGAGAAQGGGKGANANDMRSDQLANSLHVQSLEDLLTRAIEALDGRRAA